MNGSLCQAVFFRTGTVVRMIHVPIDTISGIAFGGPKLDIMFVLSYIQQIDVTIVPANSTLPPSSSPLRGQVLMISGLNAKGVGACKRLRCL